MKYIGILGLLAIMLVAFGYFTLFSSPASDSSDKLTEEQSTHAVKDDGRSNSDASEPKQGISSLEELRLLSEDLECVITYESIETSSKVEGTYFVSDGKMRGDFLTDAPDLSGKILTSIIIDGQVLHMWSEIEGSLYGMKHDLSAGTNDTVDANLPVTMNTAVQYDCKPWLEVDGTVFVPPTNVLFQDIGEMMRSGMEYGTVYQEGAVPEF